MANKVYQKVGGMSLAVLFAFLAYGSTSQPLLTAAQEDEIPEVVLLDNNIRVTFDGVVYHDDGASTWSYTVEELPEAQDLSHWVLGIPDCAPVLEAGPEPWFTVDPDPTTQVTGVKWENDSSFEQGQFWVRLDTSGQVASTTVASKAPGVSLGEIAGPGCDEGDPPEDPPDDPPVDPADQEPPTIEWLAPVGEGGVYEVEEGGSVDLAVQAADNVAVIRVEFLRWDAIANIYAPIGVDDVEPYQVTVPYTGLNPGWNQVFAASFDAEENRSDWDWIWIYRVASDPLSPPAESGIFIPLVIR